MIPSEKVRLKKVCKNKPDDFSFKAPCAFFDGAQQNNICGCGVHIIMNDKQQFFLSWNGGHGSNSMAEARALTGLVAFCVFMDIQCISIYSHSKSLIDHVNGACLISCPHLMFISCPHLMVKQNQAPLEHFETALNSTHSLFQK